jgi:sacsin
MLLDNQEEYLVGQRERLTIRLKSLIRQYQRGPGIIKEFVQNADDAGSDWVRVVMDWRDYQTGAREEASLSDVLGPALLIANGSAFSDSNFNAIQRIGESDKLLSAAKTGRFGLGFNTAYNVTDYPSLVSRDRMYCFDPHEGPIAQKDRTGLGLRLDALQRRFPSWYAAFQTGGLRGGVASHDGTIFRLPLRSLQRAAKSEICHEPFGRSDFEAIIARLVADGPAMLLFTRNVLHLSVEEIQADGGPARTVLDIRTENADEVAASRRAIQVPPDLDVNDLLERLEEEGIRNTSHRHNMSVSIAGETTSAEWHVCQGFYPDAGGKLLAQARRMLQFEERAIPEAGVAIPLKRSGTKKLVASECKGVFCCGLPLPAASGLPVHVNGCFDLDDSRTKPTTTGATSESGQARAAWNKALLTLAVAHAYADAVEGLPDDVKAADLNAFYGLWPDLSPATGDVLGEAAGAIHVALAKRPVFRCRTSEGQGWVTLAELDIPPADAEPALVEALLAQEFCLPAQPLPDVLTKGAEAASLEVNYVTPASLRDTLVVEKHTDCKLENAPFAALRKREWLEAVTRFILREKPVHLLGLPLCLLENGELAAFGHARATNTFIATAAERSIFRDFPHWFIDEHFFITTGLEAQPDAKFTVMTPQTVLLNLGKPLPKLDASSHTQWEPAGEKLPNEEWLTEVFEYFVRSDIKIARSEIENFPIIPDQHKRLHQLYGVSTPLLPSEHERLNAALGRLGLPLLSGSPLLVDAARQFSSRLNEVGIWVAEGVDLIDCLAAWRDSWKDLFPLYVPAVHDPILDALSDEQCLEKLDNARIETLASLPILPVNEGRIVDAKEPDLYLPAGEQPPAVGGRIHLAQLGKRERWRPLLEALGVKPLDLLTLIESVLLPVLPELEAERQLGVFEFIRTSFDRALQQEVARNVRRTLKGKLGAVKIVHGSDGALHAAATLFSPQLESIASVLGSNAVFLDLSAYPEPRDAWSDFFHAIGLKTKISANDLVARIDTLAAASPTPHSRKQMGAVFSYVQKHWQDLKSQQVLTGIPPSQESLPSALKRRKWLSAAMTASFPGFTPPEVQWFSPSELYPPTRGHLVAGEAPLLDGQSPTSEMLEALGFPQWPSLDVVLRRLERLVGLVAGSQSSLKLEEVRKSFDEIYRFLGRSAPPQSKARLIVTGYASRPCIWDHGWRRLLRPRDVFQSNVRFFEPHKIRITADPQVSAGLDALGRRNEAEASDFRDFLDILARHVGKSRCTNQEQEQALHALNELGRPENAEYVDDELPILTQDARLLPVGEVLRRDNERLAARIRDPDVYYAHSAIVGRAVIGKLRRLSDAVTEELAEEPMPSTDAHMQAHCRRLQDLIRSREFSFAIRRLISHECRYPVLDYEPPFRKLEVRPAIVICTTLLLKGEGGDRAVGGGEVEFFVHRDAQRIWIASRKLGALRPKLARAVNEFLGEHRLQDTAPLVTMLEGRDSIETVLENYEIAPLIEEQRAGVDWQELGGGGDQEDDSYHNSGVAESAAEEDIRVDDGDDAQAENVDGCAELGINADDAENLQKDAFDIESGMPETSSRKFRTRSSLGLTSSSSAGTKYMHRSSGAGRNAPPLGGADEAPPTTPGTGRAGQQTGMTSTGRHNAGAPPADSAGRGSQSAPTIRRRRGRFYSYAAPPPGAGTQEGDGREDGEEATAEELEIGRAAVALVLVAERAAGRTPTEMSHTNPGYDIESAESGGQVRYIEVKGIDGHWDEAGVRLSATQFKFALEKATAAWLYVVENARDPANSRIHRIQDPANTATHFCFDAGWQAVNVVEASKDEPPVVGAEYPLDDGELVMVLEVQAGAFTRLRVRSHDGSERFVIWKSRRPNAAGES